MDHERSGSVACTVHYHSPSVVCFVLLSFSRYVSHFSSSLLSYPFLSCVHLSISLSLPLLLASLLSGSGHLKSSSLSTIQLVSGHQHPPAPPSQPPTQRLPFRHSANLSPWNLSNSPCTHSAVPLISCSLHPPLLHFLALSALAA